jgi:hypothetical protein
MFLEQGILTKISKEGDSKAYIRISDEYKTGKLETLYERIIFFKIYSPHLELNKIKQDLSHI